MSDICKDLFTILENYETNFGQCYNKLRLMIDFSSISSRLSFVFISDGSFQQRLKSEVLVKAGERAALNIMKDQNFEPPFSLSRKSHVHVIDVINKFTEYLKREEST